MIALSALPDILTYCITDETMPCEVCCGEGYAVANMDGELRCLRCVTRKLTMENRERPEGWADAVMEEVEYRMAEQVMRDERIRRQDDEYGIWGNQ